MSDIELVVKIPKKLYEAYKGRPPMLGDAGMDMIAQAITNGTPLPKGHGDLIDRNEVEELEEMLCATECACCSLDGCFYDRAETIIEADRENNAMGTIYDIESNLPHEVAELVCLKCLHRWIGVYPQQTLLKDLECKCGAVGYVIKTGQSIEADGSDT